MLSYSYAFGYFLNSRSKIEFYEFIQYELENTLDILDKRSSIDLLDYIEYQPTV